MQGEWVEAGGVHRFVRRWGPNDGQPAVFLHSLGPAASGALIGVGIRPLADAGYAVAAPDGPGFGQSPPVPAEDYAVDRLAELNWSVADALGWGRLVLGGHSWGGAIAVHMARARPDRVRGLVLVDSGHLDYDDAPIGQLNATLDELTAEAETQRHRAADRAGVASDLELPVDDPVVDAFLEGTMTMGRAAS